MPQADDAVSPRAVRAFSAMVLALSTVAFVPASSTAGVPVVDVCEDDGLPNVYESFEPGYDAWLWRYTYQNNSHIAPADGPYDENMDLATIEGVWSTLEPTFIGQIQPGWSPEAVNCGDGTWDITFDTTNLADEIIPGESGIFEIVTWVPHGTAVGNHLGTARAQGWLRTLPTEPVSVAAPVAVAEPRPVIDVHEDDGLPVVYENVRPNEDAWLWHYTFENNSHIAPPETPYNENMDFGKIEGVWSMAEPIWGSIQPGWSSMAMLREDGTWDITFDTTNIMDEIIPGEVGVLEIVTWVQHGTAVSEHVGMLDAQGYLVFTPTSPVTVVGPSEVPEPATLSLLAIGGLAILRRRKA